MNDNHPPCAQDALADMKRLPAFTEARRNCVAVSVRDTTLTAGQTCRSAALWTYLLSGAVSLALVWFVIGPAWVWSINRLVSLFP